MVELMPRGIADRRHELSQRPGRGQARGEPRLEARAGGERAERRAHHRRGVDQRRQLGPHDGVASAQESIDGLIKAFGRRAGWQSGSPRSMWAPLTLANTAGRDSLQASRQVTQGAMQENTGGALGSVHHLADLA